MADDLLTGVEREKMRELSAKLDELKRSAEKEIEVANISKELQFFQELQTIRDSAWYNSLMGARQRLNETTAHADTAVRCWEEALLNLGDDDLDDFYTARSKSSKMDAVEREADAAAARYNHALLRLGWEISQAKKAGIIS